MTASFFPIAYLNHCIGISHFPLVFIKTIFPCNHLVITYLLSLPLLVIVPSEYGDPFSQGSKGNTQSSPNQVVIRQWCAEAGMVIEEIDGVN